MEVETKENICVFNELNKRIPAQTRDGAMTRTEM